MKAGRLVYRFIRRIILFCLFGFVYLYLYGSLTGRLDLWLNLYFNPGTVILAWTYSTYYLWKEEMQRLTLAAGGRLK